MARRSRSGPLSASQKEERNARDYVRNSIERLNPSRSHGAHGKDSPSIGRSSSSIWEEIKESRKENGSSWQDVRNIVEHTMDNNRRYRRGEEFRDDDFWDDRDENWPDEMYYYHEF